MFKAARSPVAREVIPGEFEELCRGKTRPTLVNKANQEFQTANATLRLPWLSPV